MICYLDTSVVLRRLLREKPGFRKWGQWSQAFASELLRVEGLRTLQRMWLQQEINEVQKMQLQAEFLRVFEGLEEIILSRSILLRAGAAFPTPVRTLDAIHIASALALQQNTSLNPIFITHDREQGLAAQALGFSVLGLS